MAGSLSLPVTTVTTGYTATASDYTIIAAPGATGTSMTILLPAPSGCKGRVYIIRRLPSAPPANSTYAQTVSLSTPSGSIFPFAAASAAATASSFTLLNNTSNTTGQPSIMLQSNGVNWYEIGSR